MKKIQKTSRYLIFILNILTVLIPIIAIIQIFSSSETIKNALPEMFLGISSIETPEGLVVLNKVEWTSFSRVIVAASTLLSFLPFFLGLFPLKSIFKNYNKNEIFTQSNGKHYRYLGWLFFLNALFAKPIASMLLTLAATLSNPPGHRYITLTFGTPNLEALFSGVIIIVISWVMLEASKLQDEQKFTI